MLSIYLLANFSRKFIKNECVTGRINAFKQPSDRTTKKQQCVLIVGVRIWNNNDNDISLSKNIYAF